MPPGRTCGSGCENGDLWGAASTAGVAPLAAIVTSGFVMTVCEMVNDLCKTRVGTIVGTGKLDLHFAEDARDSNPER